MGAREARGQHTAGRDVSDGTARGLDHEHLHANYSKWRQLLMVLHREATGVEKEQQVEEAQDVSIEDKTAWFKSVYHFTFEPDFFCSGQYAKGLMRQGLAYALGTIG